MPQVARTANDLIVRAAYLVGEFGVDEAPDALTLREGLYILNELLDQFSVNGVYIPFIKTINFTMVPGQGDYIVSDIVPADINADRIISLEQATYTVQGQLEYPLTIVNKVELFNNVRLTTIVARPSYILMSRYDEYSTITIYTKPDKAYPCALRVKIMIDELEANTDITEIPPYYHRFMRYALAREFKEFYPSGNWTEQSESEYQRMFKDIKQSNEIDLTIRPSAIMTSPRPFYWPNILAY